MGKFFMGFLVGFLLTFGSVAGFTLTYLRDDAGWELFTAEEMRNVEQGVSDLVGEVVRLRGALAKCSS